MQRSLRCGTMNKGMLRSTICALLTAAVLLAEAPVKFPKTEDPVPQNLPYSEDAVTQTKLSADGVWRLDEIAGSANVQHLSQRQRRRLVGTELRITNGKVVFFNKKVMSWKQPFPTETIGEETYETKSKEFRFDFATDPQSLQLPEYVTALDVELGSVLFAGENHILFDYQGVWFKITRTTGNTNVQ